MRKVVKLTVEFETYAVLSDDDVACGCFDPLDYIDMSEIRSGCSFRLLDEEEVAKVAEEYDCWDELREPYFNEDMGFDPYMGCYTDDC